MIPDLKITVKYGNGGSSTVDVKPRSQIAFERKFDVGITAAFGAAEGLRFEHIYFLAWHASKSSADFDDWLDTVDGIDFEVGANADPTPPVPSDGQ